MYQAWGQYDKAIEHFKKALAINVELERKDGIASCLNNIGGVYQAWGQNKEALEYYKKSLAINEELKNKDVIASGLNNIGLVYQAWGQYDKAIEHFKKALAIDEVLEKKGEIAIVLNNIGLVYQAWGQYDKAIQQYYKAWEIDVELGKKDGIARALSNLGTIYHRWGEYDKAIEHFKKALAIDEVLEKKGEIAIDLNNIGSMYLDWGQYNKAIEYFNKSIDIKEQLRLTAPGEMRMDYLESQIYTYQLLISSYIRFNKLDMAFNTVELSSAKYLVEQMGNELSEETFSFEGIKSYQNNINNNSAIVNYANINWVESAQIVADSKNIYAVEVTKSEVVSNINSLYKAEISKSISGLRGVKIIKKEDDKTSAKKNNEFENIINYYRQLLSKPNLSRKEKGTREYIAKQLYTFLFGEIEKYVIDKTELLIIPDGILGYLPFETLIMPDGRYMIEKYNIKYSQSLTVSEIIAQRDYSKTRKPLLAFGGAVYDAIGYKLDMIENSSQLAYLKKQVYTNFETGGSMREAYELLGYGEWKNLPNTLLEVKSIKEIVNGSEIITSSEVTEERIKTLSDNGELLNYKVLHFATHGVFIPSIYELSALVLSQFKEEADEDGYLRMGEISELKMEADFVNLSACETGLGKIYGGEGVVGLTQAFLIAGANGLSVSLWQVADESTMKFMVEMYKLVNESGITYDEAITEIKRKFLSGEIGNGKYMNPFYWAPFVYYGE